MEQTKRRKALNYIVGALLVLFVAIGVFSTVRFFTGKAQHLSIRGRQFEQYRVMLRPVVMNDPSAFDDVTLANENELLSIAIWNILMQDPDPDNYEFVEGEMLLPKAEVEESLLRFDKVADCACVPSDDPLGGKCLKMFAVMREGERFDAAELEGFLRERLEPYKVPRIFTAIGEIPRTANGKTDRKKLAAL